MRIFCILAARKRDSEGITKQYPDKIPVSFKNKFNGVKNDIILINTLVTQGAFVNCLRLAS